MRQVVFYSLFSLLCFGCTSSNKNETVSNTNSATEAESGQSTPANEPFKSLRQEQPGSFQNFDLLIESTATKPEDLMATIALFKAQHCGATPCNGVTLWDNEEALKLYESKQYNAKWRKKHWSFVCEHQIAYYNATVSELDMYPFMDSEYRQWGGKKKRPEKKSYDI